MSPGPWGWYRKRRYHLCRVFDPEQVTVRSARERPAADAGLTDADVGAIWDAVVRLYQTGLHPSLQLAVLHRGVVVLDRAIGHARGNEPGQAGEAAVPATPDTLYNLFSASKVVVAMLVHLLDDEGLLHLDDPVEVYLPAFGRHGKHDVTLRHVLAHRAGIPIIPGEQVDLDLLARPGEMLRLLCEARPLSAPGRRLAYHALSGGFVLGAVCEAVTGQDLPTLLRTRIADPLGLPHFRYGVAPADLPRVARDVFTGPEPRPPYSTLLRRALGVDIREGIALARDDRFLTGVIPAGNLVSTAWQTARFFECLRVGGTLDGATVFGRRTVRRAVSEQSYAELDTVMMLPVRYGLGVMLGGSRFSPFGPDTPKAFGHLGFTNVLAWADPERSLSVAFLNNGKPFITPDLVWWQRVMWTIARRVPRVPLPGPGVPVR